MPGAVAAVVVLAGGAASTAQGAGLRGAARGEPAQAALPGDGPATFKQVGTVTYPSPLKAPASFDISWVDQRTQTYYLADRSNNGIDAVNAASDAFESVIGAGDFSGTGATATAAQQAACGTTATAGPDGLLSLDVGGVRQLWAGDGVNAASPVSTVKVFDLTDPGHGTLAGTISTGGQCRADELAYDPVDHIVIMANDADSPPFVSFISVHPDPAQDKVIGTIKFPDAIDGIEQSGWDPANDMFYVNIPQVPASDGTWQGQVAVVSPRTMSVAGSFAVPGCSPGGMAIDTATQDILLGCSGDTAGGVTYPPNPAVSVIMSARTGHIVRTFGQVGGSDEVWLDPAAGTYYLAASNMTSNGEHSGYPTPVLGAINAGYGAGSRWLGNFPTAASAHSVAADSANGHVFVPIPGYGIAVFSTMPG